jgi:hypothetical protein
MQRESCRHPGPLTRSHAAPSAAAAVHVPGVPVVAPVQVPFVPQRAVWSLTSFVPHGCPAATTESVAHCFDCVLHVSSEFRSHPAVVCWFGSQVAPDWVSEAWHVPVTPLALSAPMHVKSAAQGAPLPQVAPEIPSTTHVCVSVVQSSPGPHVVSWAQDWPAVGGVAQTPQRLPGAIEQNPVVHWPGVAQVPPVARVPVVWVQPAGMFWSERKSPQSHVGYAAAHASAVPGVLPVEGAESDAVQFATVRDTHVGSSPQRVWTRWAEHAARREQYAVARSLHACAALTPPFPPSPPPLLDELLHASASIAIATPITLPTTMVPSSDEAFPRP